MMREAIKYDNVYHSGVNQGFLGHWLNIFEVDVDLMLRIILYVILIIFISINVSNSFWSLFILIVEVVICKRCSKMILI